MAIDRKHIDKVFGQKFSLLDQKMLEKYFKNEELNKETKLILKDQWENFNFEPDSLPKLDHVYYKLHYTISKTENSSLNRRNLIIKFSQIAAILIVGLFIATSIYLTRKSTPIAQSQQIEIKSNTGFRNQFKLPDGTTGWLGFDSKINYFVNNDNQRVAIIDGLVFFDVAHHKDQPFIVKTPVNLNVEVLGTRFNVLSYAEEHTCEVVLDRGSVLLTNKKGFKEEMVPNDRALYNLKTNQLEKTKVNTADFLAWIDGKLVLKDILLKDACLKLGRFYNVEIDVKATNIENEKVRLILENESLDEALKLLSVITPIAYQVVDREALDDSSFSKKKIIIKNK